MINKLSFALLFIVILGCSKFELVHDQSLKTSLLKNKTSVYIDGDNIPILKTELKNINRNSLTRFEMFLLKFS